MKIYQYLLSFIVASVAPFSDAATTSVKISWYSLATSEKFKDRSGIPLPAGTSQVGDGAVLQLGYYSGATVANPFAGTWVALTGPETGLNTTIGDSYPLDNGLFNFVHRFQSDSLNVPTIGTPLAIRFYDSTSLATANYFNCVSRTDGTWNWTLGSPEPTITLEFKVTPPLIWQGGAASAFRTTIAVPEPSVALLAASGALLAFRRRRT